MKKLLIAALLSFSVVGVYAQADEASTLTKIGQQVPAFSFNTADNKTTNIQDYKGKVVLINFFATWCPPCRLELPRVQKEIWEKYKDNPRFALLAFDREEGYDKLSPFKQTNNYTFTMLPDIGRKVYGLFAKQLIPRNVVIDESGKIIYQSIGYDEKEFAKLLLLLSNHLNKPLP